MELYDRVTQSVVNVYTLTLGSSSPLHGGTGFFIDPTHVVTAAHVVINPDGSQVSAIKISIFTQPSKKIAAKIVGVSFENDVAVLEVSYQGSPLSYAEYTPQRGQVVYTLGNLLTLDSRAFTIGTIRSNYLIDPRFPDQIDVEMPIGSGISGAPVFDCQGHVLGIVLSVIEEQVEGNIISTSTTAAISTKYLQVIASDIISGTRTVPYGDPPYRRWVSSSLGLSSAFVVPFLLDGIVYASLTGQAFIDAVNKSNLSDISGIIITSLDPDSPLSSYLYLGDVITAINGIPLGYEPGQSTLGSILFSIPPNTAVTVNARLKEDNYSQVTSFQVQTIALPIDSTNIPGPGRKVSFLSWLKSLFTSLKEVEIGPIV